MRATPPTRTTHGLLGALIGVLLVVVWAGWGFWCFVGALCAGAIGWIIGKYFVE
ncbi:MAG: hypothetical protein ACE5O2_08180 [Armatimonadota bacterium]